MRLHEERRRTERSGSAFSLLSLDTSDIVDLIVKRRELRTHQIKKVITEIIRENTRDIDIKSWQDDTTLMILMPETAISGAYVLAEKLQKKINEGFKTFFGLHNVFENKKNMTITSYPEIMKNLDEFSQPEPLVAEKVINISRPSWTKRNGYSPILKMEWTSPEQTILTWPLYSDLLEASTFVNIQKSIKRGIDVIGALFGILLLSPLMLIIAVLIKVTSPGPILYRQERMGFLGNKFTFLKFRSMYAGCDENRHKEYVTNFIKNNHDEGKCSSGDKSLYKMQDDPRITPLGRFLRKSTLDELPQFLNVLRGEMSLVGPRPAIPYECDSYDIWHKRRILEVKPGMTGLWQVKGRSSTTFDEMVRLDIQYIREWSLWLDVKILIRTPWVVFSAKGAY